MDEVEAKVRAAAQEKMGKKPQSGADAADGTE